MVVDELGRRMGVDRWRTRDNARQALIRERGALLVEPLSFMNASGPPALVIAKWHKVPPERILVVVDDLDLPFGKMRMRLRGSSGGHNGLKSLIALLGEDFPRLRIGIGRGRDGTAAIGRVLGRFSDDEEPLLEKVVAAAADGTERWLDEPAALAMQWINAWSDPQSAQARAPAADDGKNEDSPARRARRSGSDDSEQ